MALISWLLLPLSWMGLRMLGLPRFQNFIMRIPVHSVSAMTLDDIQSLGQAVNIAARHTPFPVTCLTRSLLLDMLLHRRGVASKLRIGVRLTHGRLDAHAWVECGGVPVNDRSDVATQFVPFADPVPPEVFSSP
jgi:hypothetical protein